MGIFDVKTAVVINRKRYSYDVEYEEVAPEFCDSCGHEIIWDDEKYCPFCGEKLEKELRPVKITKASSYGGGVIFLIILVMIVIMFLSR